MMENGKKRVLLMGNPNVGKSTLFNALTGLHQHTGNWPGKTVERMVGVFNYGGVSYEIEDLPGTYSLEARSQEEQVTREVLEQGDFDCVVVVCDGTCLMRNLILVYQILERTRRVIVLVNLLDEAMRRGIRVDTDKLSALLSLPVIPAAATRKSGVRPLRKAISRMCTDESLYEGAPIPETSAGKVRLAEKTAKSVISGRDSGQAYQHRLDRILTGKGTGVLVMLMLLFLLLWLTIVGANYPSECLWKGITWLYGVLNRQLSALHAPWWLQGALLDGVLLTAGRVISVMLPPMAIFFPLFTLLEDLGYLPRMAFNLDHTMASCGSCGKVGLTMCMGLGCNAVGVMGCRIIDSPRERLMAVLTNSFMPCNGRFAALIFLLTAFLVPQSGSALWAALGLTGFVLLAVLMTMLVSKCLSMTVLKGEASAFVLELPPFRKPQIGQVILRSVLDRTLFVLGRAVAVAAPAGLILWILSAVSLGNATLLQWLAGILNPLGRLLGMSGVILLGFLLGTPANEIVLPVILLAATGSFHMQTESAALASGLTALGFGPEMALCTAVFFLFHWPCATTGITIYRETGSIRWTAVAVLLPTGIGMLLCCLIHVLGLLI